MVQKNENTLKVLINVACLYVQCIRYFEISAKFGVIAGLFDC